MQKVGEAGMTIQRMLDLLEIEHECMLRGSHDACDRNCADCDLVQDDGELHEMYTDVIALLKEQEPVVPQKHYNKKADLLYACGKCSNDLKPNNRNAKFCWFCGRPVLWK